MFGSGQRLVISYLVVTTVHTTYCVCFVSVSKKLKLKFTFTDISVIHM